MSASIGCPACGARLKVRPELAGRRVVCPKCRGPFTIPEAGRRLLPAALCVAGALAIGAGALLEERPADEPTAAGRVLAAWVEAQPEGDGVVYRAQVRFAYAVGDETYIEEGIRASGPDEAAAHDALAAVPKDAEIRVVVDPARPGEGRLQGARVPAGPLPRLLEGAGLLLATVGGTLAAWRLGRLLRRPPAAGR